MRKPLLSALFVLLLVPAGARAAEVGQTGGTVACPDPATLVADPSVVSPWTFHSDGVVTELRMKRTFNGPFSVRVMRPKSATVFSTIGLASGTSDTSGTDLKLPTQIPVKAGDLLGFSASGVSSKCAQAAAATVHYDAVAAPPSGDVTLTQSSGGAPNAAATLEPDADGDGFGDDTQDKCPLDPALHDADCTADVQLTASLAEPTITEGSTGVLSLVARNAGVVPSKGVHVAVTLPNGLEVVHAAASGGACTGAACELGTLAPGTTGLMTLVVRGTLVGAKPIVATLTATTGDPDAANNAATTSLMVQSRPTIPALPMCRVPKLRGLTQAAATKALRGAGCKLGAVKRTGGARNRKVVAQTVPAGLRLLYGEPVGVTVRGAPRAARRARRTPQE